MIFSGVNLKDALVKERDRQESLLWEARRLLAETAKRDADLLERIRTGGTGSNGIIDVMPADENLFSIREIRAICIRYRLRFLNSSHFKPEIPQEALGLIHRIEKKYGITIDTFGIVAPADAFELENINKDPLMFACLGNNRFYLIHQWGHDLAWHKRIAAWPLQNFRNFFISIWVVSLCFALLMPSSVMNLINFESEVYLRIWLTIHTFIGLLGLSLWAGLAFDKTFSCLNWDSKYYNY